MAKLTAPKGYQSVLSLYETQTAIGGIKRIFEDNLSRALGLKRVSAPLFVKNQTGLNDDLNGVERPVEFDIKEAGATVQIVHSLAKWKRMALKQYAFPVGEGLYTDMNAVRRDEEIDNLHSVYVDQWDWEKVIDESSRNESYLRNTVTLIVNAICDTAEKISGLYPVLKPGLTRKVAFITTQQLEDKYPGLSPKEREHAFLKEHKTAFIMQIGDVLRSGRRHDGRAPDYDDWRLNGDIVFWNDILQCAFEISSMGIRVDKTALLKQLEIEGCENRKELMFHKALLEDKIPLSIGGGIGQSRLCMFFLRCAHIGEVQASLWSEEMIAECSENNILLK